jgi:NAD(P)-dependent dehydrogenase (short-subunit alcohol dehydrogenase family)
MDFTGKVAVVTGGGSGIGLACCVEFLENHAAVALVDFDKKTGERARDELSRLGGRIEFFHLDVSNALEVERTVAEIVAKLGRIDILVNCAGILRFASVTTCSEKEWDQVLNVNLKGAFLMSKYVIPEMIKSGGGAIVNAGSVQSVAAQRNSVHCVVSKHGLLGLTRCTALDYAKQNIRANCVLPGAVDTPMLRWSASLDPHPDRVLEACDQMHVRGKMGQPQEVAHVVDFLASDLASFVTGSAVTVEGGLLVAAGGMGFQESGTGAVDA